MDFRVWAPRADSVSVQIGHSLSTFEKSRRIEPLGGEGAGYYSGFIQGVKLGMLYKFRLGERLFPDPASRFQPAGPHGPSQVVDGKRFRWRDGNWRGVGRERQAIYEMHIGTFTEAGTWRGAAGQLEELARLGITMVEIMPVADFPGRFGWGYDGVNLFAPTRLYGTPDDFREFVNRAHEAGLGVILDVVYNHLGPDGNYLKEFSPDYFTDRYKNEWGEPINFDGENSGPVREFFLANVEYWIDEFHIDGLRLDATQQIFDVSERHILGEMSRRARKAARGRRIFLVAENETQETQLVRPLAKGGYGLDAVWNDDFHHTAKVALTGRREAYYTDYQGTPQEFVSALKWGYLFQGQRYKWQKQRRGRPGLDLKPGQFVHYVESHDQVANALRGRRAHQVSSPGIFRALTGLLLLSPQTPMLFQGEEFAASAPFYYFADHNPELARLVAKGRKEFVQQFPSSQCPEMGQLFCNPESEETFKACKIDFKERQLNREVYRMHEDLLKLRRSDPVLGLGWKRNFDGAVLSAEAFLVRFFDERQGDRLMVVNLGKDVHLDPAPEPLLAPVRGRVWELLWSSEDPDYGGTGTPPLDTDENWRIPGRSTVVLKSGSGKKHAKANTTH